MTDTLTQSTEFSVDTVVVAPPARCPDGAHLISEYRRIYDETATNENWQVVFSRAYLPYIHHAMLCHACLEYEKSRHKRAS